VNKEGTGVYIKVVFGVLVVVEEVDGCLKFNSFLKLHKHTIRMVIREANCAF
jgi:hypothetical protein